MNPVEHVLVGTDFGPASERALEVAIEVALQFDAKLTVVHVLESPPYPYPVGAPIPIPPVPIDCIRLHELDALNRTVAAARSRHANTHGLLRDGSHWREIVTAAVELEVDLIVLGTHGRRGLPRWLLGSVAQRVIRRSPVPVLTVHGFWFEDRAHAGRELAKTLEPLHVSAPTVLAITRGGIVVAAEVARALGVPFDALFTGKLQHGGLALGAVCEDGTVEVDDDAVKSLTQEERERIVATTRSALNHQALQYRGPRWITDLAETVVLVTDELMDPWCARAAARCVRKLGATRVIVAAPIGTDAAIATIAALGSDVAEVVLARTLRLRAEPVAAYRHLTEPRKNELKEQLRKAATSAA
jgi:putative phosphoribosyl transferase